MRYVCWLMFFAMLVIPLGRALAREGGDGEVRVIASFEDPDVLKRYYSSGDMALSDRYVTHGENSLKVSYGMVQPSLSVTSGPEAWDFREYEKLKLDVYLEGAPMTVTLRISDSSGKTYTSWYYLIREGHNVLEYSILGMGSVVDISRVNGLRFSSENVYAETYVMDVSDLGSGEGGLRAAILYLDRVRLTRGEEDDDWLLPEGEAEPSLQIPDNVISNGDFELGLFGWGSWGTWESGEYIFGSGMGDDAHSGLASAAIICQTRGRGGPEGRDRSALDGRRARGCVLRGS